MREQRRCFKPAETHQARLIPIISQKAPDQAFSQGFRRPLLESFIPHVFLAPTRHGPVLSTLQEPLVTRGYWALEMRLRQPSNWILIPLNFNCLYNLAFSSLKFMKSKYRSNVSTENLAYELRWAFNVKTGTLEFLGHPQGKYLSLFIMIPCGTNLFISFLN